MLLVMPAAAQPPASSSPTRPESAPPAAAQAAPIVGHLTIYGNVFSDSARILRSFEVAPGSRYSDEAVRRGIRKLFALGVFDDVWVDDPRVHDGVADLVIHVRERPRISKIEFSGNRKKSAEDLEKKLVLHPGETYAPTAVRSQIDSLIAFYRGEGFAQVSIDAVADSSVGTNQVALRFVIREGEKVKITRVVFVNRTAFPEKKLRKQLKTHARGFFGGGEVKEENFAEDRSKLEAYYHNHGYRDMRVVGHDLKPGATPRQLTYGLTLSEGPSYRMGRVSWSGASVIPVPELEALWPKKGGDLYDASRIERVQGLAYAEYAERGYLYLNVEPRETVHDSLVDVEYVVGEGRPSNVHLVNVIGNKGTREKVIRREISVHEGDRFRRSALMRTQGDISRLGLFEDVQMDFAPAESTDVDINIRVKEKQVGTASAGAGYTSQSGLTGFLELGHNNVLGNAQSLQLHLERGGKSQQYRVGFTEPWFHDTPTLLGFQLFNERLEYDLYRSKQVGGSGRIGRPLPWPDYSRGSISYQLKNVTLDVLTAIRDSLGQLVLSPQDSITFQQAGASPGEPRLTSSVETSFLRNSTDNPFYPAKGSRLTANDEFAGGPFGGSLNFHKHRLEGRLYFPSLLKGVTTMLRARIGMLSPYPDQHRPVPAYERFRLGGGTTPDPLRGYDNYMVVPDKFIREINTGFIRTIDSLTTPGVKDTIFFTQKVRYPGGRYMTLLTVEQQFPIVHPLHGVVFFDAGNTWDERREIRPFDLKLGAGIGFRLEIPLLGNIGFDYGYGFNRDDGPRAVGHFLIGNINY